MHSVFDDNALTHFALVHERFGHRVFVTACYLWQSPLMKNRSVSKISCAYHTTEWQFLKTVLTLRVSLFCTRSVSFHPSVLRRDQYATVTSVGFSSFVLSYGGAYRIPIARYLAFKVCLPPTAMRFIRTAAYVLGQDLRVQGDPHVLCSA